VDQETSSAASGKDLASPSFAFRTLDYDHISN